MEKLSLKDIENIIEDDSYYKIGKKTMICLLTLNNGFEVVESASCVNPDDFNLEIGRQLSYKKALDKVWELEGYLLQEKNIK